MPVFNYDAAARTLSLGVAFELHLDGVPIRRGIILANGPPLMAWLQSISARHAAGETPDLKPLNYDIDCASFSRVIITPVPEPFQAWLKSVPFPVRAACGETRKRPGPKPRFGSVDPLQKSSIAGELTSDFDELEWAGCDPPISPARSPKNRPVPILSLIAGIRRTVLAVDAKVENLGEVIKKLGEVDNKLERVLHLLNTQQRGEGNDDYNVFEPEL